MEEVVWCAHCGGSGADDKPPYVGICSMCGGKGELLAGEYEAITKQWDLQDAIQANREKAYELQYEAMVMEVATENDDIQRSCLDQEGFFLLDVVEDWFKKLIENDPEKALQIAQSKTPLMDAYICEYEPA
jgi:hypothetical protein